MCLINRGMITELSCSTKCCAPVLCLGALPLSLFDNYPANESKEGDQIKSVQIIGVK